jgi:hypothetical protein
MPSICSGAFGKPSALFLALQISFAAQAAAQDAVGQRGSSLAGQTLTGKERLGRKWMDEQRIDNCNVPVDKRGSKPRPSVCPHVPTG